MFKLTPLNLHCFQFKCGIPRVLYWDHFYFVNDTYLHLQSTSHLSFLQMTPTFSFHNNISKLINIVNYELSPLATWFKANKLTLHPDKTKFILFHSPRKTSNLDGLSITIDNNRLKKTQDFLVSSIKTWHGNHISKRFLPKLLNPSGSLPNFVSFFSYKFSLHII